jgi:hypothetical protein
MPCWKIKDPGAGFHHRVKARFWWQNFPGQKLGLRRSWRSLSGRRKVCRRGLESAFAAALEGCKKTDNTGIFFQLIQKYPFTPAGAKLIVVL